MRLSNDIARCMGELSNESDLQSVPCDERETCKRWLCLNAGTGQVVDVERMMKQSNDGRCEHKKEVAYD